LVFWGVKSKNFPVVFKSAVKNKRKIKGKWNIYEKLILVVGVTLKQVTEIHGILTECLY